MNVDMLPDDLLTTPEVCALFRLTPQAVTTWARQGRFKAYQLSPRVWRYSAAEIERFLSEHEKGKAS